MAEFELSLEGEARHIAADQFLAASDALFKLLRAAGEDVRWNVAHLGLGSLHITLAAEPSPRADIAAATVRGGLAALHDRAAIPSGFTPDMVRSARKLGEVVGSGGVSDARLSTDAVILRIDSILASNAREALEGKTESIGTALGRLDRVNLRGRREVGLIDRHAGTAITCTFSEDLQPDVLNLIDSDVVARGRLTRNSAGQKVRLQLWSIARLGRRPPRPVEELVGVLGTDWTDGLGSVDFVRSQRGS